MTGTKAQYREIQEKIKTSSLQDYEQWVGEWADVMQYTNDKGDTKKIYNTVKVLAQKRERPPKNIITKDADGNPLDSAEDACCSSVGEVSSYLRNKFAATAAEKQRDTMVPLPCTKNDGDDLTIKEILAGLNRLSANKE